MASISPTPKLQFFSSNGTPLVGGKLYSYAAGTTTPLATYTDESGGTANANPVILDSRGEASVWFGSAAYKLRLTTATDVDVWTVDNLNKGDSGTLAQLAASGGSALVGFLQAGAGAVTRTAQAKMRESVSVLDFGADPTGVSDSTTAFANAIAASKDVFIPKGTYLVSSISLVTAGLSGRCIYGASSTETIIKGTAGATNLLSVTGGFNQYNTFENFTIDMSLMANAATSRAIYLKQTWGNSFRNINVINNGASTFSLYLDVGTYTSVFDNCDFSSVTGVVKLQGVSLSDGVTTITFIGCSFGKMIADQVVSITLLQPIVQGALNKFELSNALGFSIMNGDIEGTGTYLALGANVGRLWSFGNELSGFSGTYSSGSFSNGALMDIYGGIPYTLSPVAGTTHNGIVTEQVSAAGATRKLIRNTSGSSSTTDIEIQNSAGSTYVGMDGSGNTYIDARGTGKAVLQQSALDRLGVSASSFLILNTVTGTTATAGTSGAPPAQVKGYIRFLNGSGTEVGKIPYYEV